MGIKMKQKELINIKKLLREHHLNFKAIGHYSLASAFETIAHWEKVEPSVEPPEKAAALMSIHEQIMRSLAGYEPLPPIDIDFIDEAHTINKEKIIILNWIESRYIVWQGLISLKR